MFQTQERVLCIALSVPSRRWWVITVTFSCHSLGSLLGMTLVRASPKTYCASLNDGGAGRVTVLLHRAEITVVLRNPC